MRTVVITGATGALGSALARSYARRGWNVVGVSRRAVDPAPGVARMVVNAQESIDDARALLAERPDLLIVNAGQIEEEIGPDGMPLAEVTRSIYEINAVFPSLVGSLACEAPRERPLDVVFVGSIADGSPSCFGPVYHASKIALHYFVTGVGPIAEQSRPGVRLRLFRPGVIRGPLSWAPVLRLNQRGRRIRARRCEAAPSAEVVAEQVVRFVESGRWVGSPDEPLSFRALRLLFALAPDLTFRLQRAAWRRASRFVEPRAGAAPAAEAGRGLPGPRLGT